MLTNNKQLEAHPLVKLASLHRYLSLLETHGSLYVTFYCTFVLFKKFYQRQAEGDTVKTTEEQEQNEDPVVMPQHRKYLNYEGVSVSF